MTEEQKLIDYALSQVGYEEPNHDNFQKYGHDIDTNFPGWYNGKKDGYDWCTQFVDDCFLHCFGEEEARRLMCRPKKTDNLGAVVKYAYGYFERAGQVGKTPKPGAVIYFQNSKGLSHTGIVVAVSGGNVTTVEGNSGKGNYFVAKSTYKATNSKIYGYGYPAYKDEPKPEPDPKTLDGYTVGETYEVICRDTLNVRVAATIKAEKVTALVPGTQFECLALTRDDQGNTWMRISSPAAGWICAIYEGDKYIGAPKEKKTLDGYTVGDFYSVVAKRGLNVRKEPTTKAGVVKVLKYGTVILCKDLRKVGSDTWMEIADGGWCAAHYGSERYIK